MSASPVVRTTDGHVATIQIGREGEVNPLGPPLLDGLAHELAAAVDGGARAIVVTGVDRSFGAGADLRQVLASSVREATDYGLHLRRTFDLVAACPVPTIAAINGYALGGGLELALACTLRVAAQGVKVGLPEAGLGLIPSAGGIQRLARLVPRGTALELLLTGRALTADDAHAIGVVDRVVGADRLREEAQALAARIAGNSPAAVRAITRSVRLGEDVPLAAAQELTDVEAVVVLEAGEWREGISAFLERRESRFTDAAQG